MREYTHHGLEARATVGKMPMLRYNAGMFAIVLAQVPPPAPAPAQPISAATVFYVTLLFIFIMWCVGGGKRLYISWRGTIVASVLPIRYA